MGKNLLCMLSFHNYGNWESGDEESKCTQVKICKRCDHESVRELAQNHQFDNFEYESDSSCLMVRTCQICDYEDRQNFHQYGSAEYVADDSCEKLRVCQRCGYQDRMSISVDHQFGSWESTNDDSNCAQVRICTRCNFRVVQPKGGSPRIGSVGVGGHFYDTNSFKYLTDKSCEGEITCIYCGFKAKREGEFLVHQYGSAEYVADDSCEKLRVCQRCGYQDRIIDPSDHQYGSAEYVADDSCEKSRVCHRCGYHHPIIVSVDHQFGPAEYVADDSCKKIEVCLRCGTQRSASNPDVKNEFHRYKFHQFGSWQKLNPHAIGNWSRDDLAGKEKRICQRCGYSQERSKQDVTVSVPYSSVTMVHGTEVERLLEACSEVTRWMRDDPSPPMRTIREIGENLNARNGKELMREVHTEFVNNGGAKWGRSLEMMWHGIGSWRG